MTGAYDEFIIVSGDADYGPLAKGFTRMHTAIAERCISRPLTAATRHG